VAGCCEYGDEPSGSGAAELVRLLHPSYFPEYFMFNKASDKIILCNENLLSISGSK
jgi:hypothetical protein